MENNEKPMGGENLYNYLFRRFQDDEKTTRIEWCKTHNRECQKCNKCSDLNRNKVIDKEVN